MAEKPNAKIQLEDIKDHKILGGVYTSLQKKGFEDNSTVYHDATTGMYFAKDNEKKEAGMLSEAQNAYMSMMVKGKHIVEKIFREADKADSKFSKDNYSIKFPVMIPRG